MDKFTVENLDLNKIIEDAKQRQDARITEQKDKFEYQQGLITELLEEAKKQNNNIQEEQRKFNKEKKQKLEQLIQETKDKQESLLAEQKSELHAQKASIMTLKKQVEESLEKIPKDSPKYSLMKTKLSYLLKMAIHEQSKLEQKHEDIERRERGKLEKLILQAKEHQQKIQQEQIVNLKAEMQDMLLSAKYRDQKIQEEFKNTIKYEKTELALLTNNVNERNKQLTKKHKDMLEKHKAYITEQMQISQYLITQGELSKAADIRQEMEEKLEAIKREVSTEQLELSKEAIRQIRNIEDAASNRNKEIFERQQAAFQSAKEEILEYERKSLLRMQKEVNEEVTRKIKDLEYEIGKKYQNVSKEQRESMIKVQKNICKQEIDLIRRQNIVQVNLIKQTKDQIDIFETKAHAEQQYIHEKQEKMIANTKITFKKFDQEAKGIFDKIEQEAQRLKEFEQQKMFKQNAAGKITPLEYDLGVDVHKKYQNLQEQKRFVGKQAKEELIKVGQYLSKSRTELISKLRDVESSKQRIVNELAEKLKNDVAALETHFRKKLEQKQKDISDAMIAAREKQYKVLSQGGEIRKLLLMVEQNQKAIESNTIDEVEKGRLLQKQAELKQCVDEANKKTIEVQKTQEDLIKRYQLELENSMVSSYANLSVERELLIEKYNIDLTEAYQNIEEEAHKLKQEHKMLLMEQEGKIQNIDNNAEELQKKIRQEQSSLMEQIKSQLKDLEQYNISPFDNLDEE